MKDYQIQEIFRKGTISYEYREKQKGASALTAALCGIMICATVLVTAFMRGCVAEQAVADCLCDQCGEVIVSADHGRCLASEVASCK
jgi:hypothetical protein